MPLFAENAAPQRNLSRLLNQVARLITRDFDRRLAPLGVNVAYLSVLGTLKAAEHLSQKDLAEVGRIGQPAMAQMLDRMVKEGLIVRASDATDRRKVLFALSQSGSDLMPKVDAAIEKGNVEIFSILGSEGLSTLTHLLQRLGDHVRPQNDQDH
jgi:DNA-binding MarR family transcriptional regulator